MISSGGDLKVCGLLLVQMERMVWPWMRWWTPLAIVSTSGSSGMPFASIGGGGLGDRGFQRDFLEEILWRDILVAL